MKKRDRLIYCAVLVATLMCLCTTKPNFKQPMWDGMKVTAPLDR